MEKIYEEVKPIIERGITFHETIDFVLRRDEEKYGESAQVYEGTLYRQEGDYIIVKIGSIPIALTGKYLKFSLSEIHILRRMHPWRPYVDPLTRAIRNMIKAERIKQKKKEMRERGWYEYPENP